MITKTIQNFNIQQIADSGQCFRMEQLPDSDGCTFTVVSGTHFLVLSQSGEQVSFSCTEEELPFWERYFDLDTDYGSLIRSISPEDFYLQKAAEAGSGIRILRQDPWEMILTFVISQQKTIPAIRSLVNALCERYGTPLPIPSGYTENGIFYTFPSPIQLQTASLEDLLSLKLGYRAKYIRRICEDACQGRLSLEALPQMDYETAMSYLQGFYGIGEKVANCICLFGLHHIDAFPVDTWIRKILLREYAPKSSCFNTIPQSRQCDFLIREHFSRYQGYSGVMQQYIFYYERTSDRDIKK